MPQHDYNLENQLFPDFRADLNNALQAAVSQNAGDNEPSVKYANMLWADTGNDLFKRRNKDNTDWIVLGGLDQADSQVVHSGSPVGNQTPGHIGQILYDNVNSQLYYASGSGSNDWTLISDHGNVSDINAYESSVNGRLIDLGGQTYTVSSIPFNNRYQNGFFKLGNIKHPAHNTLQATTKKLTNNLKYSAWSQDKAHTYNGVIYLFYNEGLSHANGTHRIQMKVSYDGGDNFTEAEELHFGHVDGEMSFSAGVKDGRQYLVVQKNAANSNNPISQHLYHRRLAERKVLANNINTISGSATVTIDMPDHGMLNGDQIEITSAGGSPATGGVIISGIYSITRVDNNSFTIDAGSNATSTVTGGGDSDIVYEVQKSSWSELLFGSNNLGDALAAKAEFSTVPNSIHSFAEIGNAICLGASNGGGEIALVKVHDVFTTPSISVIPFNFSLNRAEPTVANDSAGNLYGFLRTQDTQKPVFWTSTNGGVTINEYPFAFDLAKYSPIPLTVSEIDNTIYAIASERVNSENQPTNDLPLYLLRADKDQALSNGWAAFEVIEIGKLYFAGKVLNETSNAVGIPSITQLDNKLLLFYSTEEAYHGPVSETAANIYMTAIALDNYTQSVINREKIIN